MSSPIIYQKKLWEMKYWEGNITGISNIQNIILIGYQIV